MDGKFDQVREQVNGVVPTSGLSVGHHTVYVRGQEASGAWGPVSAAFFWVGVTNADLSIFAGIPAVVLPGMPFPYTLTVSNAGPQTASGIVLTNRLPLGTTFQNAGPAAH